MKKAKFLKPLILAIPLILVGDGNQLASNAANSRAVCDNPNSNPYKVHLSITKDENGEMLLEFTNYTLKVGPKGRAPNPPPARSPLIYICLDGLAEFPSAGDKIRWSKPQNEITPDNNGNRHPKTQFILRNKNSKEEIFEYLIRVTSEFGTMVIDPRIENGGGGHN